ncbi:Thermostable monoacylglycerol lipase [compost metagenome]
MENIDLRQEFFFAGNETGCLLIHGFTSTPAEIRELGERLSEVGYTVLGVKLAGHGTVVEDLEKSTYKDWIRSVEEGYERLNGICSSIHVVGHSMGGVLALYVAENYEVNKIVTLAPALVTNNKAAKYAGIVKYVMKYKIWDKEERPEEESQYLLGYSKMPLSSIAELNKLQRFIKKSLHNIVRPLLIIHSIKDQSIHEKGIELLVNGVSSKEIKKVYLNDCGHNITVEREKSKVFQEVISFLA